MRKCLLGLVSVHAMCARSRNVHLFLSSVTITAQHQKAKCGQDIKSAGSLSDAALEVLTVDEATFRHLVGELLASLDSSCPAFGLAASV